MNKILKKITSILPVKFFLYNRTVLYILCILALLNVVMYANAKDFNSVATLLIVGFLVSFFSKNMVVILAVAIGVTYILNYTNVKMLSEGVENMDKEEKEPAEEEEDEEPAEEDKKESMEEEKEKPAEDDKKEKPNDEEKQKMYNDLQRDFKDFQKIQDSILTGMKEIDPLLTKAETFIEKFEHYGKQLESY